jgi:fatty-acyl-CoA synthase
MRDGKRFLRTGDLGYADEDGYFFLVDRLKRMINVSGFKVWPAELEAMLHQHRKIRDVCVVGIPDPRRGEAVKALIVPRGKPASDKALRNWCRARMAAYKVPAIFEHVDALPLSASGKVLWRELQHAERDSAAGAHATARR